MKMFNFKSLLATTLFAIPIVLGGAHAQEGGSGTRNGGYVNGAPIHQQEAPAATITSGMSSAGRGLSGPSVTTPNEVITSPPQTPVAPGAGRGSGSSGDGSGSGGGNGGN